jgi:demethylmenaquinone methyltransferase/2-methoxy-6-polyprenyl-1,4-benzoquinol methylase
MLSISVIVKFFLSLLSDLNILIIFFSLTFKDKYLIVVSTSGSSGMNKQDKSIKYNVKDIFKKVADEKYDLMNDVMSLGAHRLWKKYYVNLIEKLHKSSENILDIASGTGDIFNSLNRTNNLFAIDPIYEMHTLSKKKNSKKLIHYETGFVEKMPYKKNYFQMISCSYGVRNFEDKNKGFKEIARCLKKNGYFLFMEFGTPKRELLIKPFKLYLNDWLPLIGSIVAKDRHSYKYLAESIQKVIIRQVESAGLTHQKTIDFLSGSNSIYIFKK